MDDYTLRPSATENKTKRQIGGAQNQLTRTWLEKMLPII